MKDELILNPFPYLGSKDNTTFCNMITDRKDKLQIRTKVRFVVRAAAVREASAKQQKPLIKTNNNNNGVASSRSKRTAN